MARRRNRRRGRRRQRGFFAWAAWQKVLAIIGGVLVLVMTAGIALTASKLGKIEQTTLDPEKLNISKEVEHNETGYLNVALFGLDSRDGTLGEGNLSDTIIIASLNRETKEIRLCSVYRDTLLQQADGSYNKANAAYSFGGAEDAVALLNKNLDMDIQHYVTVNFNALADIVDELGGVEIDLTEEEVYWTNGYCTETKKVVGRETTELTTPGLQTLDGIQATAYCRIRYAGTGTDFERTQRQRTVLEQIATKVQAADLSTLNRIIDKVFPEIATNFTLTEILAYAKDVFDYRLGEMNGFPFEKSTPTLSGVGSCVIPETLESNVIELHKFLFGEDGYSPSSTVLEISGAVAGYALYGDYTGNYEENYYEEPQDTSGWSENGNAYTEPSGENGSGTGESNTGGDNMSGYEEPGTVTTPNEEETLGSGVTGEGTGTE